LHASIRLVTATLFARCLKKIKLLRLHI